MATPETSTLTTSKTPQVSQNFPPQEAFHGKRFIVGIILLAVLLGTGAYYVSRKPAEQKTVQTVSNISRSINPGIITDVITSSSLDSQGSAVNPATVFSRTEKNIYLVLTLNKPPVGTKVEYIRYLNNRLLDSNAISISKSNTTHASFVWSLKNPQATHLIGNYRVKVYTNGVFERETFYSVQ